MKGKMYLIIISLSLLLVNCSMAQTADINSSRQKDSVKTNYFIDKLNDRQKELETLFNKRIEELKQTDPVLISIIARVNEIAGVHEKYIKVQKLNVDVKKERSGSESSKEKK